MRVFLIILGILMLLPGACGAIVLGIAFIEGDPGAVVIFSVPFILIGIGGIALIRKQVGKPPELLRPPDEQQP